MRFISFQILGVGLGRTLNIFFLWSSNVYITILLEIFKMKLKSKKQIELSVAERALLTKESIGIVEIKDAQLKMIAGGMMNNTRQTNPNTGTKGCM